MVGTLSTVRRLAARVDVPAWALALVVGAVALLVRVVAFRTSYEVHIDEVTYARIADTVARTGRVDLYGEPFFLHPPLVFLTEGLLLRVLGLDGADLDVVLGLRLVPILAAAATAALLTVLVAHCARSRAAGVVAGLFFALDPFVVRQTSRNLLESPALLWVVVSVTAASFLVRPGHRRVRRRLLEVVTGVAAGLALLTKEPTAFVVVLPLVVAAVTGWSVPRGSAVRAVVLSALVYLVYPVVTVLTGRGEAFAEDKLSGVLRLIGQKQETGFNAGRGPSLADAVLANLPAFGPTYALLAASAPAVLVLLLRGSPRERWLATWTGCAQVLLAYLVLRGTLEEQFFSYLVVPSAAATAAAGALLLRRGGRAALATSVLAGAAGTAFLLVASVAWAQSTLQRHDGYAQALDALRRSAPCGTTVSATAEPVKFLLDGYRVVEIGRLVGPQPDPPEYVVTSSKQVDDGFGAADETTLATLEEVGERLFVSTRSDGAGQVVLWRLPGAPRGTCATPQA